MGHSFSLVLIYRFGRIFRFLLHGGGITRARNQQEGSENDLNYKHMYRTTRFCKHHDHRFDNLSCIWSEFYFSRVMGNKSHHGCYLVTRTGLGNLLLRAWTFLEIVLDWAHKIFRIWTVSPLCRKELRQWQAATPPSMDFIKHLT
jgi:hypothetical protein